MNKRIVTVLAAIACSPSNAADPMPSETLDDEAASTESDATPVDAPTEDRSAVTRLDGPSRWPSTPAINATVDEKRVFRGDGSCFVYGAVEGPRPPGYMGPREVIDCPEEMTDPAWDLCRAGTLHPAPEGRCHCAVSGNPPPPGFAISRCPVHSED